MTTLSAVDSIKNAIARLPARAPDDVAAYRAAIADNRAGTLPDDVFRSLRASLGVYEERQDGRYMARVRFPAGLVLPAQMRRLADLAAEHGNGFLHVTTRQDVQIHGLSLDGTLAVHEALLAVGLATSASGGNAVRNVSACPRAGVCPKARFDVTPFALATGEHLLALDVATGLPRKFKAAFSGCSDDCAFASVNDVGFFAHERDGALGFAVYAAGGLGREPRAAELIEDFVPAEEAPIVAEALLRLFARLGDRSNRNRARLRFVLARLGRDQFLAEYAKERRAVAACTSVAPAAHDKPSVPSIAPAGFLPERSAHRFTLELRLPAGKIASSDFGRVADVAERFGIGLVCATQQQDLLVFGIADNDAVAAQTALASGDIPPARGPKVVACVGRDVCRLGLCPAPRLAQAISEAASAGGDDLTVRISGCTNSCGNHTIAALGFEGRLRRQDGATVEAYDVLVGGHPGEGDVHFSERVGTLAATDIPALVATVVGKKLRTAQQIRALVETRKIV